MQDPVIFTSNNREVTFKATTQQPIQQGSTTFGTATAATTSSIAYIEVGTELTVLPSVLPGAGSGREIVLLSLSIEVSTIIGQQVIGGNPYPITSTRTYSYSVPIPDRPDPGDRGFGAAQRIRRTDSKVPLLGDIPVVGYAFKSQTDQVQHTTLLAFITPEVIADEGASAVRPLRCPRSGTGNSRAPRPRRWRRSTRAWTRLPQDIADLQACAAPANKEAVLNRLDRIAVELALMDVRLGELRLTGDRLTAPAALEVAQDRELSDGARAKVAQTGLEAVD